MYKKILVPLDGSSLAEAVLSHAQALATSEDAEIILLRVSVNPAAEFSFSDPSLASSLIDSLEAESLTYLQSIRAKLQKAGLRTSFLIRQGPIAETILHVATEVNADIVAMSTHGRTGVSRWLLGSIANRVVNHSPIPVLLIRPQSS
jgi:nucleotide-binding universal stress UspA family protein